jgi:hypothetical protein
MERNIFEIASRKRIRFSTNKGLLGVEELWDLSLQSLDTIAKAVNKQLKESQEESFIDKPVSSVNSEQELALDILKHIIQVKIQERDAAKTRTEKQAKLASLKELAARKAGEEMSAKSLDDINQMIADLEKE